MLKINYFIFSLVIGFYSFELNAMATFEELMKPDKAQIAATATEIAAQYELNVESLRDYYSVLHFLAKQIVQISHRKQQVEINSKVTEAINPGTAQIEPGCVGIEFHRGLPRAFWSILGCLPICECGVVYDDNTLHEIFTAITNFLRLKKVKELEPGYSLWKFSLDNNQTARPSSPALIERKRTIPYDHAVDLWRAVKPEERESYH